MCRTALGGTMLRFVNACMISMVLTASATAQSDFAAISAKVNPVMQPKSPGDVFRQCANSSVCRIVADAAAVYLGVPPGRVKAALAAVPKASRKGEEGRYQINLPGGYEYCRSRITTISVVPATGDRASVMGVTATQNGMSVYTWTPKKGFGGGRSWIEADFMIIGVRSDLGNNYRASGQCRSYNRTIISCRGARGVNKGQPACGSVQD